MPLPLGFWRCKRPSLQQMCKAKCVEVNRLFPFEGHANLPLGWWCWTQSDWRKPPFPSGHALVTSGFTCHGTAGRPVVTGQQSQSAVSERCADILCGLSNCRGRLVDGPVLWNGHSVTTSSNINLKKNSHCFPQVFLMTKIYTTQSLENYFPDTVVEESGKSQP